MYSKVIELDNIEPINRVDRIYNKSGGPAYLFHAANITPDRRTNNYYGHNNMNNFVRTYWDCFVGHGSAVFSPSDLWLVITLSFAKYSHENPKVLQNYVNPDFNGNNQKKELKIVSLNTGDWITDIKSMVTEIANNSYNPDFVSDLENTFECATQVEKTACNIAVMKAVSYFYKYSFQSYCGFTSVKLIGDKSDWELLKKKVLDLSKYEVNESDKSDESDKSGEKENGSNIAVIDHRARDKKWLMEYTTKNIEKKIKWSEYVQNVVNIIDKFLLAFEDKPDKEFFRNMVHNEKEFGFYGDSTDAISGWILKLFYGYADNYIVSEVPVLEAHVDASYDENGDGNYKPIVIKSGFEGHQRTTTADFKEMEYRPITFCGISWS